MPTEFFLMRTEPPPPPFWLQSEAEVECRRSGGTREDCPEDEVRELMWGPPLQPPPEASVTEVVAVAAPLLPPLLPVVPMLLSVLSGGCSGFI